MDKNYEQLIADYLAGNLDKEQKVRVEELIASGEIDFVEFRELETLHEDLGAIPIPKPSEQQSIRFYEMLEEEKQQVRASWTNRLLEIPRSIFALLTMPRLAYAAVLLMIGGFAGAQFGSSDSEIEQLSREMQQMKEMMMVNMLEGASAADRLKAVNISTELPGADTEAIHALLFTLNNDPSVNVRVQTIEALKRWGDNERVRQGLVQSIAKQQSPIVIVELADAMLELELKNSAPEFQRLLQERELDYTVQQKLQTSIAMLM
ncbi:hypothetical protein [Gracilimonas mengyeensis]|uniref:HEAT repeat-containing protein n=1 Tax=Gracilimonas mengyeensis TaxID=1302730 RepID=A0A521C4T3_9BACT|nr:hypothetical protein [Gracilimonas mengyeensis]SMO54345.1 hypothetical protein SAMN06265219_104152 [Gracilimonas mengyeensis]